LAGGSGEELQQTAPSVGGVDLLAKRIGAVAEAFQIAVLQLDPDCSRSKTCRRVESDSAENSISVSYSLQ
jgi:hypothetical protein